jgi:oligoendopeptidase F
MNKETWDLTPIYKNSQLWYQDYESLLKIINDIKEDKSFLKNGEALYNALENNNKLGRNVSKLYVYAKLIHDANGLDIEASKMMQNADNLMALYQAKTSYIGVTLKKLTKKVLEKLIKEYPNLGEYHHFFTVLFKEKRHILSLKEEKIMANSEVIRNTAENVFEALDYVDATFKDILVNGKKENLNHANYFLFLKDKNIVKRKQAFNNYHEFYQKHHDTLSNCLLGSLKNDSFIAKTRKYKSTLAMALDDDDLKPQIYHGIINSVHDNIDLFHDYLRLRKQANNLVKQHMYDIYLPSSSYNKKFTYEEAQKLVLESVKVLGEDYYQDYQKAFKEHWIDPFYRKGKYSGAYSSGTYDTYPYVLLNYQDNFQSVETLAHEMGHSMHSYYSRQNNLCQNAAYPIFLAEIASNVNEILLFNYMLNNAQNDDEKKYFLETILDSFKGSIFRQIQFAEYEMIIHDKIDQNIALSSQELSDIYYDLNKFYYGNEVVSDDLIRYEYLRIPHFYFAFYVYKYATGLALAYVFASRILNKEKGALENYLKLLKSGGQDYPLNILKSCGVEVNKNIINEAMKTFKKYLVEYRKLVGEENGNK